MKKGNNVVYIGCRVFPGMFSDEKAVSFDLPDGRVINAYVNERDVVSEPPSSEGRCEKIGWIRKNWEIRGLETIALFEKIDCRANVKADFFNLFIKKFLLAFFHSFRRRGGRPDGSRFR
jgi:hypothetical protein